MNRSSHDLLSDGCLYITGKGGSFVSFLIAHSGKKILVLYEDEGSAEFMREEISYYGNTDVAFFPPYEDRFFEDEDKIKRTGFLLPDNCRGTVHRVISRSMPSPVPFPLPGQCRTMP